MYSLTYHMHDQAYSVDPTFITDTEAVSALLEILAPLASSVHLCIIGQSVSQSVSRCGFGRARVRESMRGNSEL